MRDGARRFWTLLGWLVLLGIGPTALLTAFLLLRLFLGF